jgi:hypothetical protein
MATTFKLFGWHKDKSITLFVDAETGDALNVGKQLYPEIRFHASQQELKPVPEAAKNKLFTSDEELYAAVPELNPRRRRARR